MLDKHNYHTFQPLLYQVATGSLEAESIAFSLRKNYSKQNNFRFKIAEVDKVNVDKNTLDTSIGEVKYDYLVIATGSKPSALPFLKIDKKRIITSTEALSLKEIPKHLVLIGGGVIGLELGSVYARLGSKVSVVEYMDSIIPTMDKGLGRELQKVLAKLGMEF